MTEAAGETAHHGELAGRARELNFCPACGAALTDRWAFGRMRRYCAACEHVVFHEHKVAAAMLLTDAEGQVLLVQRAMSPLQGHWSLPAGFVDEDESPEDAAVRECREETGLDAQIDGLLKIISGREHARGADIIIVYRGHVTNGQLLAGDDAAAARYFSLEELPPLAFRATEQALEAWQSLQQGGAG